MDCDTCLPPRTFPCFSSAAVVGGGFAACRRIDRSRPGVAPLPPLVLSAMRQARQHSCDRDSNALGYAGCASHLDFRYVEDSQSLPWQSRTTLSHMTQGPARFQEHGLLPGHGVDIDSAVPDHALRSSTSCDELRSEPAIKSGYPPDGQSAHRPRTRIGTHLERPCAWVPGGHQPLRQRVHSAGGPRPCFRGRESALRR
jgi:hypothetical protein